jgi:hypothetical protein
MSTTPTGTPPVHAGHTQHGHQHGGPLNPLNIDPGQHAFIMLGEKALFLCHMTMFDMEEHCYQLILRATLPDETMKLYLAGLNQSPRTTYFLGNSNSDLLTVADLASGARRGFLADLFRGVPDRPKSDGWPWDGRPQFLVAANVEVTVDRVVYHRHFDMGLEHPKKLTYVLFGEGDEAHLNHFQTKEPDFDHVLSLSGRPDWLPKRKLEASVHVTFPSLASSPLHCRDPLDPGVHDVQYQGQGATLKLGVRESWWFSTAIVNSKDPCA